MTRIGHTGREALQEFLAAVAQRHGVYQIPADHAKTVQRTKAVLEAHELGKTHRAFLDALRLLGGPSVIWSSAKSMAPSENKNH